MTVHDPCPPTPMSASSNSTGYSIAKGVRLKHQELRGRCYFIFNCLPLAFFYMYLQRRCPRSPEEVSEGEDTDVEGHLYVGGGVWPRSSKRDEEATEGASHDSPGSRVSYLTVPAGACRGNHCTTRRE